MISPRIDPSCQQTKLASADCQGRIGGRGVNCFTLRIIVILMETIKDLYIRTDSDCHRPPTLRPSAPPRPARDGKQGSMNPEGAARNTMPGVLTVSNQSREGGPYSPADD